MIQLKLYRKRADPDVYVWIKSPMLEAIFKRYCDDNKLGRHRREGLVFYPVQRICADHAWSVVTKYSYEGLIPGERISIAPLFQVKRLSEGFEQKLFSRFCTKNLIQSSATKLSRDLKMILGHYYWHFKEKYDQCKSIVEENQTAL